ncbi:hypothetical protein EQZ23_10850 [Sphingomonas sp. UV9]|uniref:hypothetical protein n=1 Tax=Sphingomonas sp. UV9 TaxID=1851410 RepID=UPI000FFB43B2|nr:hypothetical protein [Sphingomonas sp. UV9]RXD05549.1 hypothetical protein EQZ23_10850 [Sphingomonas sp. UV9]
MKTTKVLTPAHTAASSQLYDARRLRDEVFGFDREGFGEPGWDMMLALTARGEMSAEDLAASASAPAPIAATYLDWLMSRELVTRCDPKKIALAERGRSLMLTYLDRQAGRV